uniref:Uncharacterized protein n=1 Tax=Streptomyces sp. NBC_00049 TaxID=2903617 RepID=A0AAU2JKY2_9ACTN
MDESELAGDPARCVELTVPEWREDTITVSTLRLTPADVVRLRLESDLVMSEIRGEVMRAELAWKQQLGRWYDEGRAAVESREPDVALLARVLEGLRRAALVPV